MALIAAGALEAQNALVQPQAVEVQAGQVMQFGNSLKWAMPPYAVAVVKLSVSKR